MKEPHDRSLRPVLRPTSRWPSASAASRGHERQPYSALLCLMVSGLLDAFDGRIARTEEKTAPSRKSAASRLTRSTTWSASACSPASSAPPSAAASGGCARASFSILAALIRLAYFNVTEEERQSATNEHRHYYLGVPSPPPPLSCRFSGRCRCASALRRP